MNGKKNWSKILLVLGVLIGVVGVSYALWLVTFSSTNNNTITATCFKVSFTDQNNISIEKAYPLLDEEGKKLTPYEFTITNNCDSYVKYDINLEILNNSTLTNMDYIKLMLDDETPTLVSRYNVTTKTLSNASSAYKIKTSYLDAKESKTYNLRLWLDENVTGETEGVQNNTFASKITVNASYTEEIPSLPIVETIAKLAKTDSVNMATDDYDNIRYIGSNPNNYIKVDGELWRIIGLMKDIDDGTNKKESRIKIIRNESIGNYSWDTSDESVNTGSGVNEWSEADLMKLLNPGYESEEVGGSLYWNSQSGTCYHYTENETVECDFTATGMKEQLKKLIDNAVWNTGAPSSLSETPSNFYADERGTTGKLCTTSNYCNDTVERTTTWTGKIGLMYISDYGYATSGGTTLDRTSCLNLTLNYWNPWDNSGKAEDCYNNDWLFKSENIRMLSPKSDSSFASGVLGITDSGNSSWPGAATYLSIYPAAYLKPTVKIVSGTGSQEDPFVLSL